jgi:hypothetical protein
MRSQPVYVVNQSPEIYGRISGDLHHIVRRVVGLLGHEVGAVYLVGGFGRGEGGVYKRDGQIVPANDYDLVIATNVSLRRRRQLAKLLSGLAPELAVELNIKQVDLALLTIKELKRLPCTIFGYELLHGHQVLYGNLDLRKITPALNAGAIPLAEGARLLFNRGAGMLISARYFSHDQFLELPEAYQRNFLIECSKAALAMGDCILLLAKQYHYSYRQRLKMIDAVDFDRLPVKVTRDLISAYRDALNFKIAPDFENYGQRPYVSWWFQIQSEYEIFYRQFEQYRLGWDRNSWYTYGRPLETQSPKAPTNIIKNMLRLRLNAPHGAIGLLCSPQIYLMKILPLLLFSFRAGADPDRDLLRAAEQSLHLQPGNISPLRRWEKATDKFLRLWH